MTKSKGTRLTEADFTKIKKLLDLNIPQGMIVELTGRSVGSIHRVKKYDSYADFLKVYTGKRKTTKPKSEPTDVLTALTNLNNQMQIMLNKLDDVLEAVNANVAEVEEEVAKANRWFGK